jgi:hypothetical protein
MLNNDLLSTFNRYNSNMTISVKLVIIKKSTMLYPYITQ